MRKFRSGKFFRKLCFKCFGRARRERVGTNLGAKAREAVFRARTRAEKLKLPCTIDALWFVEKWDKQVGKCYYTARKLTLKSGPEVVSIDRKDSSRGYTPGNCVLCCSHANMMKRSMTEMEFIAWCEEVAQHRAAKRQNRRAARQESGPAAAPGQDAPPGDAPAPGKGPEERP
jgi:hypothetical protein